MNAGDTNIIGPLLFALVVSVLGVLVTMLFRRPQQAPPIDVQALIETTAAALSRAIVDAQRGSAGSLAPAHWENFFHNLERGQDEQLRGQGATHSKVDKLAELQVQLVVKLDRLCDAVEKGNGR